MFKSEMEDAEELSSESEADDDKDANYYSPRGIGGKRNKAAECPATSIIVE